MRSSALVGWFADIGLADRLEVGGKGGSLGELTRAGIAVPPGFVLKTAALSVRPWKSIPVRERVESLKQRSATTAALQVWPIRATPLPPTADEIATAHEALSRQQTAVAGVHHGGRATPVAGLQDGTCG